MDIMEELTQRYPALSGCYLNCGCTYEHVLHAVELGMITEEQVRYAATKLMTTRMKLGMFDAHTPFDHLD